MSTIATAEEGAEDAEEASELSPQSRNPISVCAVWRVTLLASSFYF
jgi:hypothetical protein